MSTASQPSLYPPIEPHEHGLLDVGDGHRVSWEVCGDPPGKPAGFLHGGPGGGCSLGHRRLLDPERYRVEQGDLIATDRRRLTDPAPQLAAARAWSLWEGETITLLPNAGSSRQLGADAFARIETHYLVHAGWLEEDPLLRDAHRLRAIPGAIVQGRYDVATPAATAWDLHRAWPEAEFRLIEGAGHALSEPDVRDALLAATDRFAGWPAG